MFTHFFIARPILSSVISLLIVLAGAVSLFVSPIEQYPEMAPPQVQVWMCIGFESCFGRQRFPQRRFL
jgi:multidrug efflux pump subunit AcrB